MKQIYVCDSKIHGKGIRAGEDIKKGEIIQPIKGKMCFLTVKNKKDSLSHPNWIGIAENQWIDPTKPFKFLNHSCKPNSGVKGKVNIVAIKNIKEGEEITIDYSIIEGDNLWEMKCVCNEKGCREVIRSVQHLPEKTFKKYLPFVPNYFKKLYENKDKDLKTA